MQATLAADQLPDGFPDGPCFVALSTISRIEKGRTGIQQAQPGPFPLVTTANDRSTCDHFDFEGAAAIVPLVSSTGHGKASINRLHYEKGRFALGTILAAVLPRDPTIVSARFLFEYLSAFKEELLVTRMTGTANVTLTIGRLGEVPVPLIPFVVQQVADDLMALCDRLEAARTVREATRDLLAAASLARLNIPDSETFPADARFILDALPALTTRPDQIKQLRQIILNLAVRGKLMPQDAGDEPASQLIDRMRCNFLKSGDRKASGRFTRITEDQLSYTAPAGWEWACAEDLTVPGEVITYGILKPEWMEDGVPTVRVTEMKTGTIDVTALPKCSPARAARFSRTTLAEGDLLVSKDGTIGKTAFVPPELVGGNITQHVLRFPISTVIDRHFVKLVIDAPPYQAMMAGETKGVALQGVNVGDFRRIPILLPPLAEQHRIVAKVSALMALCDQLKANLATASTTRAKLLEAMLRDALLPAEETLLEAAQ